MEILITGASGYVGARLYVDLKKYFDVTGTYHSTKLWPELLEMDVTNPSQVSKIVGQIKPDYIIHVAANASSKWCAKNPKEAEDLNSRGTENIVIAANQTGAKVIYISSVAAIPANDLYGKTKKEGEDFVRKVKNGYIILRPSLILGLSPNTTNDRPFNRILKNLDEHTPAIYNNNWKFQPTWAGHISEIIIAVIKRNTKNEVISIAVPEMRTRFEVARDILKPFNIKVEPEDKEDNAAIIPIKLGKFKELDLPQYSYQEIISKIVKEIKQR